MHGRTNNGFSRLVFRRALVFLVPSKNEMWISVHCLFEESTDLVLSVGCGWFRYRAERNGIIHTSIGKLSFTDKQLIENLKALQLALLDARPKGAPKGVYFKVVVLLGQDRLIDFCLLYTSPSPRDRG